jgi:hypothetical protein
MRLVHNPGQLSAPQLATLAMAIHMEKEIGFYCPRGAQKTSAKKLCAYNLLKPTDWKPYVEGGYGVTDLGFEVFAKVKTPEGDR